jgi:hypothetical protein
VNLSYPPESELLLFRGWRRYLWVPLQTYVHKNPLGPMVGQVTRFKHSTIMQNLELKELEKPFLRKKKNNFDKIITNYILVSDTETDATVLHTWCV